MSDDKNGKYVIILQGKKIMHDMAFTEQAFHLKLQTFLSAYIEQIAILKTTYATIPYFCSTLIRPWVDEGAYSVHQPLHISLIP